MFEDCRHLHKLFFKANQLVIWKSYRLGVGVKDNEGALCRSYRLVALGKCLEVALRTPRRRNIFFEVRPIHFLMWTCLSPFRRVSLSIPNPVAADQLAKVHYCKPANPRRGQPHLQGSQLSQYSCSSFNLSQSHLLHFNHPSTPS